ncbi:hypothetical protein [Streptomyces sp. MJM1172]|uniref:hypothetical protein n=1 Tax=Streptomyces sp. MJM1172 TaxID=1703926 RepID=UPI00093AE1F6|nr:hypothetical protein [Streptomyces sp. MJM1172]OKI52683.1 hypothetical protein AMK15_30205 [Streptomyces sp. MJM1172]
MTDAEAPARFLVVQAASPRVAGSPDAGAEYREIQRSVEGSQYRHAVALDSLPAARPADLSDRLIKEVPAVLHFSARGTPDGGGLRFQTSAGADASGADADYLRDLRSSPGTIPEAEHLIGPQFRVPPARTPVKPSGGKLPRFPFGRKPRL